MSDITERDYRVWEKEIEQDFYSIHKDFTERAEAIRKKLQWGRDNRAWANLGYQSWTKWVNAFAERLDVTPRRVWKILSEDKKPQKQIGLPTEPGSVNSGLTGSKTPIPEDSEPEDGEKFPDESLPPIDVYLDKTKRQVPERLVAFFREFDDQVRPIELLLKQLKSAINDNYDPTQRVWQDFKRQKSLDCIFNIQEYLRKIRPWAWCPQCGGDGGIEGNCLQCHGKGWCRWLQWSTVPDDLKD